jgi:hypothetical protein
MVVLDRDPRTVAVDDIPGIAVHSVFLGGERIFTGTGVAD